MKDFDIPVERWFHQTIGEEEVTNVYVGSKRKDPFYPICYLNQYNFDYRITYDTETRTFTLEFAFYKMFDYPLEKYRIDLLEYDSLLPLLRGFYTKFVRESK